MKRIALIILLLTSGCAGLHQTAGPPGSPPSTAAIATHAAESDPHTGYALESVFGTSLNADDLELSGGVLQTAAEIPHIDAAANISAEWEVQDDICYAFGTDSDVQICWDSAAAVLEFRDSADSPFAWADPTNKSWNTAATASPEFSIFDSDGAGAERADKYAGGVGANFTTTTEDGEISDWLSYALLAGFKILIGHFDGSDEAWIFGSYDGTNNADGENIEFDFSTAGQVDISSPAGATLLNLGTLGLSTTGVIKGRAEYGADIAGAEAHDTTETHGVFYHFTAAATVTLDAAADAGYGAQVCYRIRDAGEAAIIDIQAGEKVNLAGTALAAGTGITATGVGESVCMVSTTDTDASGTDGWEAWGPTSGWASQ